MGAIQSKRNQKYTFTISQISSPMPIQNPLSMPTPKNQIIISEPSLKIIPKQSDDTYQERELPTCLPYTEAQLLMASNTMDNETSNNNNDLLLTLPEEVLHLILNQLSIESLGKLLQTNKFWFAYLLKSNDIWFGALKRSDFSSQIDFAAVQKTKLRPLDIVSYKLTERQCVQCLRPYREKDLAKKTCDYHRGQWDLVHNGGGPSGVRWVCCGSTDKQNKQCRYPMCHTLKAEILSEHDKTIFYLFRHLIASMPYP